MADDDESSQQQQQTPGRFVYPRGQPITTYTPTQRKEQFKSAFAYLCLQCDNYSPREMIEDETAYRAVFMLRELIYENDKFLIDKPSLKLLTKCKLHVLIANFLQYMIIDHFDEFDFNNDQLQRQLDLIELDNNICNDQNDELVDGSLINDQQRLVRAVFIFNCCMCILVQLIAAQFKDWHVYRVIQKLLEYNLVKCLVKIYKKILKGKFPAEDVYFVLFFLDKLVLNPHLDRTEWQSFKLDQILVKKQVNLSSEWHEESTFSVNNKNELIDRILTNIERKTTLESVLTILADGNLFDDSERVNLAASGLLFVKEFLNEVSDRRILKESAGNEESLFLKLKFDETSIRVLLKINERREELGLAEWLWLKPAVSIGVTQSETLASVARSCAFFIGYAALLSLEFNLKFQENGGLRVILGDLLSDRRLIERAVESMPSSRSSLSGRLSEGANSLATAGDEPQQGEYGTSDADGSFLRDLIYICDIIGWSFRTRLNLREADVLIKNVGLIVECMESNGVIRASSSLDVLTVGKCFDSFIKKKHFMLYQIFDLFEYLGTNI
jgi:hypothetical protein